MNSRVMCMPLPWLHRYGISFFDMIQRDIDVMTGAIRIHNCVEARRILVHACDLITAQSNSMQ